MTTQTTPAYVDRCLEGAELYGDTFTPEQIQSWYADEKEAYANLYGGTRESCDDEYHAFNRIHGFSGLPAGRLGRVLGMGAALATRLDWLGCSLTAWNRRYHATTSIQKLRPGSVYLVLRKR